MDYSLLVAQKEGPAGSFDRDRCPYHQVMVSKSTTDGQDVATYIGIIDYLQQWNFSKVVANCIKFLETNKATIKPTPYGDRFYKHFEKAFFTK